MANITLLGASYTDVPAVTLPQTGGGTVTFYENGGGTPAISVVDTTDTHGGTIRTITALDISDTTAVASVVQSGYYFYTAQGQKTQGTASGGGGATQHTIHLEFSDSTDTDIDVYYDNSLLGTMITAYQPSTWAYNNKTVVTATLDNNTWYDKTTTWETIWDSITSFNSEPSDSYAYITDFVSTQITANSIWRVTWGNEVRIHTAVYGKAYPEQYGDSWIIDSLNDGTNGTYTMYSGNDFWLFIDFDDTTNHSKYVKLEQAVTS